MEHMIGLTDTAYLGRVGEVELGASALAGVYYLVIYMLGFGFSIGAQVLIARRNGAQEYKRIGPVFLQGTFFLLLLASLLFTASHLYSPFFLRKLIGSDDVYQATSTLYNERQQPVTVHYRFFWYDARGLEMHPLDAPRTIVVPARSSVTLYGSANILGAHKARLYLYL